LTYVIIALWSIHFFFVKDLTFTGDEVRYVAYGLGISKGEGPHVSDHSWREMLKEKHLDWYENPAKTKIIHSVIYPILGSYFIGNWGLDGARWFSFAIGALGIIILYDALRRVYSHDESISTIVLVSFSCPLLFYLRLFFSEIFLFTLNCALVSFFVSKMHLRARNAYIASFAVCLLPFVHLKLSLEAAVATLIIFYEFYKSEKSNLKRGLLLCQSAGMLALFIIYNTMMFGAPIGGANPAFKVSILAIPDRIIVNLFDFHHGLISNAPLLIVSFIGFIIGIVNKDKELRIVIILFIAYFFTMLWANGSEAYAARNWTAIIPMLAFGVAHWIKKGGSFNHALAIPFFVISLCLLCLGMNSPNLFLDNRTYSLPFDALYALAPYFHFGYYLPNDFLDHEGAASGAALALGLPIVLILSCFVTGQLASLHARWKTAGICLQILALFTILFFSYVKKCDDVNIAFAEDENNYYLNIHINTPGDPAFIRIENASATMKPYGFFSFWVHSDDSWKYQCSRASVITPLAPFETIDSIAIAEPKTDSGKAWLTTATNAQFFQRRLSLF